MLCSVGILQSYSTKYLVSHGDTTHLLPYTVSYGDTAEKEGGQEHHHKEDLRPGRPIGAARRPVVIEDCQLQK